MSEMKFTPGEWTACFAIAGRLLDGQLLGWHITAPEFGSSDPICERRDGFDRSQRTDDEERANARLIAAAPNLYEALSAVNKLISEAAMTGFNWKDGDWAERLFLSQQATSRALHLARGDGPQPLCSKHDSGD